jgi:long-chain acyl-CoA synthetase
MRLLIGWSLEEACTVRPRLIHHAFEAMAHARPEHVALVCGDQRVLYATLAKQARQIARRLLHVGVHRGDRVVVCLDASAEYAAVCHAVWMAGAVLVPVAPSANVTRVAQRVTDAGASAVVMQSRDALPLQSILALVQTPLPKGLVVGELPLATAQTGWVGLPEAADEAADAAPLNSPCSDQDLAALLYTSGSSGEPKGVMLTHANMLTAWHSVQSYLRLQSSDVIGLALPLTHSYGLYNLLMGLGLGATVVLERQAAFALKLAQTLLRERVTVLPAVPTLLASLLDLPSQPANNGSDTPLTTLPSLRMVTNAAAPLSFGLQARVRLQWPHARLVSMYGLTECKRVSYLDPDDLDARPGSVGRGMPNQTHWLIDELGHRLPHGSTGELVVCGNHVMQGYWRQPEATAQRLRRDGEGEQVALHTGDVFRSDAQGYLYFVGRKDDLFKSRGEKVAPRLVEDVIERLPQVTACAVIGVPDEVLGLAIKAVIAVRPGVSLSNQAVLLHCREHLESHLVPKHLAFVDDLPRTENGKVSRGLLRQLGANAPDPVLAGQPEGATAPHTP